MDGNIFISQSLHVISRGVHVAIVCKALRPERRGKLVGHLANERASDRRLDKATDRLFRPLI
jgi:hypothetical protein